MVVAQTQATGLYWEWFDLLDTRFNCAQGYSISNFTIKLTTEMVIQNRPTAQLLVWLPIPLCLTQKQILWPSDEITLPYSGLPNTPAFRYSTVLLSFPSRMFERLQDLT